MKIHHIFLIAGFLAFIALAYIYFPESIDDAYITLRYSKNLLLGNGPVFNIGERVEGYSNFSWMVLLAAFGWIGVPMEMAMKVLSFVSGVGVLALVWKFSANNFKSGLAVTSASNPFGDLIIFCRMVCRWPRNDVLYNASYIARVFAGCRQKQPAVDRPYCRPGRVNQAGGNYVFPHRGNVPDV